MKLIGKEEDLLIFKDQVGNEGQTAMFRRLQERTDIFGGEVDHSQNS